jgi:hypothetical protein
MDFKQRSEAERRAIKACWDGLAAELLSTVNRWNERCDSATRCVPGNPDAGNRFYVTGPDQIEFGRGQQTRKATATVECEFNPEKREVTVEHGTWYMYDGGRTERGPGPIGVRYQIVVNSASEASLQGTDGKLVSTEDAAYAILKPFLEPHK